MVARLNLEWLKEEKAPCQTWKDYLKKKILYLIIKYYHNKPIYIQYFRRFGSYYTIRKILDELANEKILIKYTKTKPMYYLYVKEFVFSPANKYKFKYCKR